MSTSFCEAFCVPKSETVFGREKVSLSEFFLLDILIILHSQTYKNSK